MKYRNDNRLECLFISVCRHLNTSKEDIIRKDRTQNGVVYARHIFHYLAIELKIGTIRDIVRYTERTTACAHNSHKRIKAWISYDDDVIEDVEAIKQGITDDMRVIELEKFMQKIPVEDIIEFLNYAEGFQKIKNESREMDVQFKYA